MYIHVHTCTYMYVHVCIYMYVKGNGAVHKELYLVTVTIIRSFAAIRAILTYVYWFSVLTGYASTDQQKKKEDR